MPVEVHTYADMALCTAQLQRGNLWAALALLDRASSFDVRCSPVLRWAPVRLARSAVDARQRLPGHAREH